MTAATETDSVIVLHKNQFYKITGPLAVEVHEFIGQRPCAETSTIHPAECCDAQQGEPEGGGPCLQ